MIYYIILNLADRDSFAKCLYQWKGERTNDAAEKKYLNFLCSIQGIERKKKEMSFFIRNMCRVRHIHNR